jgi:hypothetical protein
MYTSKTFNPELIQQTRARTQSECEANIDEYNNKIIAERLAEVEGKTIIGTLTFDGKRYWIRWNSKKHDTVYITSKLVKETLGEGIELKQKVAAGVQIKCTINGLGPDMKNMRCKTAWFLHPQTDAIEIVQSEPKPLRKMFSGMRRAQFTPKKTVSCDRFERSRFFGNRQQGECVNWRRSS